MRIVKPFKYLIFAINIWDDWFMNSALLLADSAFSSLGISRIFMFKGCGIDITTILRSLTTFVKAIIVLLLAASLLALMRDWTCSRSEKKMFADFNQPIFSLRKFSCPSCFNLCEALSEVLLVNCNDDAKQEISLYVIFGSILEIGQICHNLLMSLNLLHEVLNCELWAN